MTLNLAAVATSLALIAAPVFADVVYDDETKSLTISGDTTSAQQALVESSLAINDVGTIYMSGPGGEVYAGLAIGRAIHAEGARVIIVKDTDCTSACAFAAMGSADVNIDGVLRIHRPYANGVPTAATLDEIAGFYGEAYMDIAGYMMEVGYTFQFARMIVTDTSPCEFYTINYSDTLDAMRGKPMDEVNTKLAKINTCF